MEGRCDVPSNGPAIHISEFCGQIYRFTLNRRHEPVPTDPAIIDRECSRPDALNAVTGFIALHTGLESEEVSEYIYRAAIGGRWGRWKRQDPDDPKRSVVLENISATAQKISAQSDRLMADLLPRFWEQYADVAEAIKAPRPTSLSNGEPSTIGHEVPSPRAGRGGAETKGRPGRKPKAKPDKFDRVIRAMIVSGDVQRYERKWKSELLPRYAAKLPKGMTPGSLRKRVEREEKLGAADKN